MAGGLAKAMSSVFLLKLMCNQPLQQQSPQQQIPLLPLVIKMQSPSLPLVIKMRVVIEDFNKDFMLCMAVGIK